MSKKRKIPRTVLAVVENLKRGQTLCKLLRRKETGETEVIFFYEPSGRQCGPKTAQKAIAAGLLKPSGDGLFGPESSQTWIAA